MKYVVRTQCLENYGSEEDFFKYKFGSEYLVEANRDATALAKVALETAKTNSQYMVEYPLMVFTYEEWLMELNEYDEEYRTFKVEQLMDLT